MLALACTIHELRDNFERLKFAIGPALEGKGCIGLWPYGPYKGQHFRRVTGAMVGQMNSSSRG
jgi:hypothetical protein